MKISACYITKNEEENLKRSIESLKEVADEIIVVDTGSTDGTVAAAESFGAKIGYFEWINDFSAARNHALDMATGDIIIFLDADEWFDPKLEAADRAKIETPFIKNPAIDSLSTDFMDIEASTGLDKVGTTAIMRIYLNRPSIRYKHRIHESATVKRSLRVSGGLSLKHSGYSAGIMGEKAARNVSMLEESLNVTDPDEFEQIRLRMYLIRESMSIGSHEKLSEHIGQILKHSAILERVCKYYDFTTITNFYEIINGARVVRPTVSRLEIKQKLISLFKKTYAGYPGAPEIDLLYQIYFDLKEDRLLRELEPAIAAAKNLTATDKHYQKQECSIYTAAAQAAKRRGDMLHAMDYAVSALNDTKNRHPVLLQIILNAIKGQPPQDIVLFLNSYFDLTEPEDLNFLVANAALEGFEDVYAYYLKKRTEMGTVPEDSLNLMLLTRNYGRFAAVVEEALAAGTEFAPRYLFIAAVCGALPQDKKDMLGEYEPVFDAYLSGEPLENIGAFEINLMLANYDMITLYAGREAGEKLLRLYKTVPSLAFVTKALYCDKNSRLDLLLEDDLSWVDPLDAGKRAYIIQALINTGRYGEAYEQLGAFFANEMIQGNMLQMLLVVAEKAGGETGKAARKLYDRYIPVFDAVIDLGDVVNTGVVIDMGGVKQRKAFKSMTRAQFEKLIAGEKENTVTKELLSLNRKAAAVCREKDVPAEAASCLCRLIAHDDADRQDYLDLADIFEALKNTLLPGYLRERSESARPRISLAADI